jgi:hypothetical protein
MYFIEIKLFFDELRCAPLRASVFQRVLVVAESKVTASMLGISGANL